MADDTGNPLSRADDGTVGVSDATIATGNTDTGSGSHSRCGARTEAAQERQLQLLGASVFEPNAVTRVR